MAKKKTVTMYRGGKEDGETAEFLPGAIQAAQRHGYKLYAADAKEAEVQKVEGADGAVGYAPTALTSKDTGISRSTDKKE